jgi:hypothetical protein
MTSASVRFTIVRRTHSRTWTAAHPAERALERPTTFSASG